MVCRTTVSEVLHIENFEIFVKSMICCLSKLKVTPSFCFTSKIPDDPTATILVSTYSRGPNKHVGREFLEIY